MQHEATSADLAKYRLEKTRVMLADARLLFEANQLASANNRAYYCIFHTIRAVLALREMDFRKHSAVISAFNRDYIREGIFDRSFGTIINNASLIRNHSDYDDFYLCSHSETSELIADASVFLEAVTEYLRGQGCLLSKL